MQQQQMPTPQFKFEGGHLVMYHQESTGLTQAVKDSNVNDRDRMQDLLATEKYLTNAYDTFLNEASHDALFQVVKQNHSKCQDLQRQVYNTMFKKGWYKLAVADAQSVSDAYNKAVQAKNQLPFPSKMGQPTGSRVPNVSITQAMQQAQQQAQQQQKAQMTQPPTQAVSDSPTKSRSQAQTVSPVQSFTPAQQQAATQVQTQVHSAQTGGTQQH